MTLRETLRISHYRVEQELARDALGYFFRAVDEHLDRPVVLRVARAGQIWEGAELMNVRRRIRERARIAARLSHPHLVTIYEFLSMSESDLVVMEHVDGTSLEEMRRGGHRWTVIEVARLLGQLADALAAAHAAGLVHGGVSTVNVRVRPDERAKLLDLGVPKLAWLQADPEPTPQGDVRALAIIASDLLVPAGPAGRPAGSPPLQPDSVSGRALFGFMAPVLAGALKDPPAYETAAQFRDALAEAAENARARPAFLDSESAPATRLVGPRPPATDEADPTFGPTLEKFEAAGAHSGRRLALMPDMAERLPDTAKQPTLIASGSKLRERLGSNLLVTLGIAATLVLAIGLGAALFIRRVDERSGASAATLPAGATIPSDSLAAMIDADIGAADSVGTNEEATGRALTPAGAAGPRALLAAWVRADPPGTRIRRRDGAGQWQDSVRLEVAFGDTVPLVFERNGYVARRASFSGSRLAVTLAPDSVTARFNANVPAEVFLIANGRAQRLGPTPLTTRLPSGSHRIRFRSPGQADWEAVHAMTRAGQTFTVSKTDYPTHGGLVVTVSGGWATATLDGVMARETPARFDSIPVGYHILRLTRDGFAAIADTVLVEAGRTVRRSYTLRR